ncbi:pilus assembly protein PilM [Robertmurraya korlensis]|jgi:cell division protein FtsA|uniref:pilus assembly protein PilM n=1 Tax=Robertmurraya korlensis TaxID=519977 RepID=UPI000825F044|nr:pilus assembly protein PilM [Robertmurraya korlensis]
MNNKLFALDIGTRSCVGIILEETNDQYHVVDMLSIEHSERAMLDGQIHDVMAVSKLITQIKEELEINHGPLHKVCVAAAGRALRTERSKVSLPINGKPIMQKQDILHLELLAVQHAQAAVAEKYKEEKSHYYYCVGYSVLYYRLDGEEIGSLIDQQGDEASVEIIATFLPKVVVESLLAALTRSGLEMEALTLEPIAAINVLIPPSMRRLNVALVDIGAGTSDIALTDLGTVIAYGMVPIAGDEITEAISDQFLLDFPLAEIAKRQLNTQDSITVTDILGFETEVSKAEAIEQISYAIDRLALSICEEVLQLNNNKPPKAVMLVGGGSLTPELSKKIAEKLQLPANRVAIRGIDAISSLTVSDKITKGPELVTPIGIALAAKQSPVQYRTVYVNEQPVRLFEVKTLTVGDCLLAAGIKMNKLYGRPGLAMIVSLNEKNITIPGQYGAPPTLLKNGECCSLDDPIENGDTLFVEKGQDGDPTILSIGQLLDDIPMKEVEINRNTYQIEPSFICNGETVNTNYILKDRDAIVFHFPKTIEDLFYNLNLTNLLEDLHPFHLILNGKDTFYPSFSGKLYRNGVESKLQSSFENRDKITVQKRGTITVQDLADLNQYILNQTIPVTFNDKEILLKKDITIITRGDTILSEDCTIHDGDSLSITHQRLQPFIFQDIFKEVDIHLPKDTNGSFILLKNNEETTFYDPLEPFDSIKIIFPTQKGSQEIK